MKTVVTVLGMSDRVAGTNKSSGKPYDFRKVAFGFVNQYGSDDVCVVPVNTPVIDEVQLRSGGQYWAIVNQAKNQYFIDVLHDVGMLDA